MGNIFNIMAMQALNKKENADLVEHYMGELEADGKLLTTEEIGGLVMGVSNPFRAIGSAKNFIKIYGHHKGWKGHKLDVDNSTIQNILDRVSKATGVSIGSLAKFAQQKISGAKSAIKANREISLKHGERFRKSKGARTKVFGGWQGGKSAGPGGKSLTMKDFDDILREELYK